MTMTRPKPLELVLRSIDATWDRDRWETLPADDHRYEVIDGVLYMTTAPSSFHQWVIRKIVFALGRQIDEPGIGVTLWAPIGLFMPGCDPVQPDILVVRIEDLGMFHDRRIFGVPALLIEVLSPSNAEQDTEIKLGAYARAGVAEYWIVRPAERDILVYSQPNPRLSSYAKCDQIATNGELASPTLPFRSTIAGFFADAPDATV